MYIYAHTRTYIHTYIHTYKARLAQARSVRRPGIRKLVVSESGFLGGSL